ncbi:MAG: hypothetical protein JSS34_03310 [Proteobacteria bacterium]|nr:hypothetical protein [Pseudomonadota bacterium]
MNFLEKEALISKSIMVSLLTGMIFIPSYSFGMEEHLEEASRARLSAATRQEADPVLNVLENADKSLIFFKKSAREFECLIKSQTPKEKNESLDSLWKYFNRVDLPSIKKLCAGIFLAHHGTDIQKEEVKSFLTLFVDNEGISSKERIGGLSVLLDIFSDDIQKERYLQLLESIFTHLPLSEVEGRLEAARCFIEDEEATAEQKTQGFSALHSIITNDRIPQEYRTEAAILLFENADNLEETTEARRLLMIVLKEKTLSLKERVDIAQTFYDKGTPEEQVDPDVLKLMLQVPELPAEVRDFIEKQLPAS